MKARIHGGGAHVRDSRNKSDLDLVDECHGSLWLLHNCTASFGLHGPPVHAGTLTNAFERNAFEGINGRDVPEHNSRDGPKSKLPVFLPSLQVVEN